MALPSVPTKRSIITEGIRKAVGSSFDATALSRAEEEWFEEVKDDIFQRKDWKILEETKILIPSAYEQRIADPTDYEKMLEVTFYDGGQKGTAQGGSLSSIQLSVSEGLTEGAAKGSLIFKTGGTGKAEASRIVNYDELTKIATVSPNFISIADASTTYMVATTARDLHFIPNEPISNISSTGYPSRISYFDSEFYLDPIPKLGTYAIVLKYLVSISQVDLESIRHLKILSKMKNALKAGIYMRMLDSIGDDRYISAVKEYEIAVIRLMVNDSRSRRQRNNNHFKPIGGMPIRRN